MYNMLVVTQFSSESFSRNGTLLETARGQHYSLLKKNKQQRKQTKKNPLILTDILTFSNNKKSPLVNVEFYYYEDRSLHALDFCHDNKLFKVQDNEHIKARITMQKLDLIEQKELAQPCSNFILRIVQYYDIFLFQSEAI